MSQITISIIDTLMKELEEYAAHHRMTVGDYILSEILLKVRGCFVRCDNCGKVLADEREFVGGKYIVKCECGNEMNIEAYDPFDDE